VSDFDGKVPNTIDDLCSLPGVGPKMALITLRVNHNITAGIAVDTHVHRICNQLGWTLTPGGTKQPEQTRKAIESWMPRDIWPHVNLILVGLGQEVQTEQQKLISKALKSSNPSAALDLLNKLGLNPKKFVTQFYKKMQRVEQQQEESDFDLLLKSLPDSLKSQIITKTKN